MNAEHLMLPKLAIARATHADGVAVNGTGISVKGFRELVILVTLGTMTTASLAVKLQDSDAIGGTYADFHTFTAIPDGADDTVKAFRVLLGEDASLKEFVRPVITPSGGTVVAEVTMIAFNPRDHEYLEDGAGADLVTWQTLDGVGVV